MTPARPMARLVARLSWRNLRHHRATSILLLLALGTATTALSMAVTLDAAARAPWDHTRAATRGADVLVTAGPDHAQISAWRQAPGVAASSGPWPVVFVRGVVGTQRQEVAVVGRSAARSSVEQPLVTSGRWLGEGGIVLERSFAHALGVRVGDPMTLAGHRLVVLGLAVTVSRGSFPLTSPGLAWGSEALVSELAPRADMRDSMLALRLADPTDAAAFVDREIAAGMAGSARTGQQVRSDALAQTRTTRVILLTAGSLLALLTLASIAVLVASRMAGQIRQVGTLKAIGMTPRQVASVLLAEHLVLALVAAALGIVAGHHLVGQVAGDAVNLLASPEPLPVRLSQVAAVAGAACLVVILGTASPALRAARESTVVSLHGDVPGVRTAMLGHGAGAARLPVTVVLGVRSVGRRPVRALLATASTALGLAMVVAALSMERTFEVERGHPFVSGSTTPPLMDRAVLAAAQTADDDKLRTLVYTLTGLMLLLAVVNAVIVAVFAVHDSAANHARMRAAGLTPRQTMAALLTTQAVGSLGATLVGVPLGLLLFRIAYVASNGNDQALVFAQPLWVLGAAVATWIVCTAVVAAPAGLLAKRPVAQTLAVE